ncbi:hypothetical protein QFC22_004075 [Naganishia vaughanmartiniae]|uniref:Uncharacterized protein n=1 Tax=Naganishia vaughanmartiniae TaxID=1424756 RepID=A0ACC2X429_9TREE|nr:hypothetical protein QFC22_004075 [Naganishia vaughanmartiniae]
MTTYLSSSFSWEDVISSTASATKASVSVILVLLYGFLSRRYDFLTQETEDQISSLSVSLFLPSLLFSEIGPLATPKNLASYWIIIVVSLVFQLTSFVFGIIGWKLLKMPQWIVPCVVFNNATSLPLLLLESLGTTGTLKQLMRDGETMDDVLDRGRVYLLINALVCNLTRFAFGPYLLQQDTTLKLTYSEFSYPIRRLKEVKDQLPSLSDVPNMLSSTEQGEYPDITPYPSTSGETQPLLSQQQVTRVSRTVGHRLKAGCVKIGEYVNPPMLGGGLAIILGLIPFMRHALFDNTGLLSPLADSVDRLGSLYTVLQMFVLGAHLYSKQGGRPAFWPMFYLFMIRFVVMTVLGCSAVYGIRHVLGSVVKEDPMLDFILILIPIGPPALTLAAIVEMSDASEATHAAVAQTILISYALTPFISLSVSAALTTVKLLY